MTGQTDIRSPSIRVERFSTFSDFRNSKKSANVAARAALLSF